MLRFQNLLRRWRLRRSGQVFTYFDGRRQRDGDPLQLWRAFIHYPANLPALAPAVDEQKEPETTQFLQGLCEVFGLTRYDAATGTGLTDAEILNVLAAFYQYLENVKKKAGLGSTSSSPTAGKS